MGARSAIITGPCIGTGAEKGTIAIDPAGHRASGRRTLADAVHGTNDFDLYDVI